MDTFENWYTNILEEVATAPTKTLSGDVDTIINSLGTLVKELTEELNSPELNTLNEIDGEGPSKVWQWIWWMPKAIKAQQKVNKIKLNITDMEAAAEDAPDTDQRAKINAKATIAKDQANELQTLVDDKFNAKGELVAKALHNEKIAGKIASIKRASGLEDDPEKKASYKEKMAELQVKYKQDQAAMKELEPSEEDKAAEIEKKKEEQRLAKEKQDKLDADAEAAKTGKKDGDDDTTGAQGKEPSGSQGPQGGEPSGSQGAQGNQGEPSGSQGAQGNQGEPSGSQGAQGNQGEPKDDDNTTKIAAKESEITQLKADLAAEKEKETPDADKVAEIESKITSKNTELEELKAPAATNDSLIIRAKAAGLNELAAEIASKFDWQVSEGTVLHQNYDAIIKKAEYSNTLNESRYQNLSIKDRFSRLL